MTTLGKLFTYIHLCHKQYNLVLTKVNATWLITWFKFTCGWLRVGAFTKINSTLGQLVNKLTCWSRRSTLRTSRHQSDDSQSHWQSLSFSSSAVNCRQLWKLPAPRHQCDLTCHNPQHIEFEFYEFFSFLKFNEFYEFFFRWKQFAKNL